jgi:hypothetical protein
MRWDIRAYSPRSAADLDALGNTASNCARYPLQTTAEEGCHRLTPGSLRGDHCDTTEDTLIEFLTALQESKPYGPRRQCEGPSDFVRDLHSQKG